MRNLKKVLSLVLALVMTLSLATVAFAATPTAAPTAAPATATTTTSASTLDFTDADKITNVDAVSLLNSLGVLEGYEDGSYGPAKTVTRAEAAKIVCYVLLGATVASGLGEATVDTGFTDMKDSEWAAGYVQYCATVGVINGYGDGRFGPTDTVTTYQLAKMLLVALGYGQNDEYIGTSWATNVAVDAMKAGVLPKGTINEDCTRDMTALVAYNTLLAPTATYANGVYATSTTKTVNSTYPTYVYNGTTLVEVSVPYTKTAAVDNDTLGTTNFNLVEYKGNVVYTTINGKNTFALQRVVDGSVTSTVVAIDASVEDLNHSASVWTLYNKTTKTYSFVTDVVVAGKTIATSGNGTTISKLTTATEKDYIASFNYSSSNSVDVDFYVNGAAVTQTVATDHSVTLGSYYLYNNDVYYSADAVGNYTNNETDKAVASAKGVGVELYDADNDGDVDAVYLTVKTVNTLAADVTVKTDPDKTVTITTKEGTTITGKSAEMVGFEGLKKDTVILSVKMSNGVTYIETAKAVEGTLTKIASEVKGSDTIYTYTFAGAAYNASGLKNATATALNTSGITGKTATIYLDSFGYIVATKDAVTTSTAQFIYITKVFSAASTDKYSATTSVTWVQGVLADGTTAEYEIYNDGGAGTVTIGNTTYTYASIAGATSGQAMAYTGTVASYNNLLTKVQQYALKDGKIVLVVPAAAAANAEGVISNNLVAINKTSTAKLDNNYFASDVKFIYVSGDGSTLKVTTVDGVQNVLANVARTYTVGKDTNGNYVITAVFLQGLASTTSADLIYFGTGAAAGNEGYTDANGKLQTGYLYTGYINGVKTTVLASNATATVADNTYYAYSVSNNVYSLTAINAASGSYTEANYSVVTDDAITAIYNNYFSTSGHNDMIATNAVIVDLVNTHPGETAITTMAALATAKQTNTVKVSYGYDSYSKVTAIYITSIKSDAAALIIDGTSYTSTTITLGGNAATTAKTFALTVPAGATLTSVGTGTAPITGADNGDVGTIAIANTASAGDHQSISVGVTSASGTLVTYTVKVGVGSAAVTGTVAATTEIASVHFDSATAITVTSASGQTVTGALLDTALESAITGAAATSSVATALSATGDTVTVVAQDGVTTATYNITYVATP